MRFDRTKYSTSYLMAAGVFFTISSGAQASELKQSSSKQTKPSIFDTHSLLTQSVSDKKTSKKKEQKKNLTIAQQIPKENLKTPTNDKRSTKSKNPHRLYIGPDLFYRDYNEIVSPAKSHEFGTLYGVQATYDYVKGNSIYVGASLRYGNGTTTYDGSTRSNSAPIPVAAKTNNQFLNAEGRLGYTFSLDKRNRLLISPFVGVGYHQWNRDVLSGLTSDGKPTGSSFENYSWGYVGPGIQAKYQVSPQFDIGINAKLMMMLGGKIDATDKTSTGQVTGSGSGELGNALQYEVELPITYHLSHNADSNINLKLTPYYRSQNIAEGSRFKLSNGNNVNEPASNTSVYGVDFGAEFAF
jgi:hypothetical protein